MDKTIGIVGLGRCGMPAARKFLENGYTVFGHARRPEVIKQFENMGGIHVESPKEMATKAKIIIVMVLNDEQVSEVIKGSRGILQGDGAGNVVICMSTINRSNLQALNKECNEKKIDLVDCPFTGGPPRIENATLSLITAAPENVLEKCRPHMEVIGQLIVVGNEPGLGQAVKHCNQLMVCAIHSATVEVITLAKKTGVNPQQVCEVVSGGIGGSEYFNLLYQAILENKNSPGGMGQLWKDINMVNASARDHNLPLLVANAAGLYFDMAVSQGMAKEDSARMINVMERMTEQ